jgi:diguanylate cyclase (GGDEF)-like protein
MYMMDPRTTVLIGGITSGLMALVLTMLARAAPLPVPGLRTWVAGAWLVFTALLLVGLRDWITPLASVTLGNSALMLAYIVWLAGTCQYFGDRMRWRYWLAAWILATLAVTWFVYGERSFRARLVIVAGFCACIGIFHALLLLRRLQADRSGKGIGIALTASCHAALALVYGIRALHAGLLPQGNSGLLTQDTIQIVYTGSFTICNLLLVIGFATLASDHVRARIEEQARRDPLTGAFNRQALVECLEREFAQNLRGGHAFSVAMLDVDHFKKINDGYGHPIGDKVLVHLCRQIERLVRPHDVLARYGGEEFFIVMPGTALPAAVLAAQRILTEAVRVDDPSLPGFTISIGVAQWSHEDASIAALVARTDAALYQAKANGRNRVEIAATSATSATPAIPQPHHPSSATPPVISPSAA